jgi:hypothetical protein
MNYSQFTKPTKYTQLFTYKYYIYRSDMFRYSKHNLQEARNAKLKINYDRSKASSKESSPPIAIECFLFQFPVSSRFLKVIQ